MQQAYCEQNVFSLPYYNQRVPCSLVDIKSTAIFRNRLTDCHLLPDQYKATKLNLTPSLVQLSSAAFYTPLGLTMNRTILLE